MMDRGMRKPACSATETSLRFETLYIEISGFSINFYMFKKENKYTYMMNYLYLLNQQQSMIVLQGTTSDKVAAEMAAAELSIKVWNTCQLLTGNILFKMSPLARKPVLSFRVSDQVQLE